MLNAIWPHLRRTGITCAGLALSLVILLVSATSLSAQDRILEGTVRDAGTNAALGAVEVTAGPAQTLSGADGRFSIRVGQGVSTLVFDRLGYSRITMSVEDWSGQVHMAPQPIPMTELTVRSEGRSALARGTALTVESVNRDQLHGRGHTSVAQSLAGAEGVSVAWTGSWGARPMLRGLGGERLAVLVDGNRVTRACISGMDQGLATVDPASVERVEILTGPGSTLYGSGSVGGVINVVTRRPAEDDPFSGEVRATTGSAAPGGSLGATASSRQGSLDLTGSVDLSRFSDYRSPAAVVEGSSYEQGTVDLKAGWEMTPSRRLNLQMQAYEGRDIGWPMSGMAEIPAEGRRSASVDYSWQRGGLLDAFSTRAYIQRVQHHMLMRMPAGGNMGGMGGNPMGDSGDMTSMAGNAMAQADGTAMTTTDARSHSTTSGARAQFRILPNARSHLDLGADLTHIGAEATRWIERTGMGDEGMSMTPGGMDGTDPPSSEIFRSWPAVRIMTLGLFAQGELRVADRLALTAGVRGDHVGRRADGWDSTRDQVITGNSGFRLDLSPQWSVRASAGRGFRVPDATEYFGLTLRPDGFVYQGNPDLDTETSLNLEASLTHQRGPFTASMTVFRNDMAGLIAPVAMSGEMISGRPVRSYQNVDDARLMGGTISTDVALHPRATVSAVLNHVRGEDRDTGEYLPEIPPTEGSVGLEVRPFQDPAHWVELELRAAARQSRNAVELGEMETPGYGLMSLRTGRSFLGVDWVAGVDNVLDKAYRSHVDPSPPLLRPGRNVHLSAVRRF